MKTDFITFSKFLIISSILLLNSCEPVIKKDLNISPIFTDHMVIQQQQDVAVWGTYSTNQNISVSASWGADVSTKTDANGYWKLKLPTPKAGGPFEIKITTLDKTITLKDVMVGEVWLASGQSNMEMPLKGFLPNELINNGDEEIANANHPEIRMFTVQKNLSAIKIDSLTGNWQVSSPQTAADFSATAYFFARKLYKELNVPIGIIHSSWGGTVAEAWASKEGLSEFPEFLDIVNAYDATKITEWVSKFEKKPLPNTLKAFEELDMDNTKIADPQFDDSQWAQTTLPAQQCNFENFIKNSNSSQALNGAFWYRKHIDIENVDFDYTLHIGAIDDNDITYVNGQKVGTTWGWSEKRIYTVPKELLKKGDNIIAILQFDSGGGSPIAGPMYLENEKGNNISIEGNWAGLFYADLYKQSLLVYGTENQDKLSDKPKISSGGPNELPTSLFNAMINPLVPFNIKGAIWYQGESNVGRAEQYEALFPAMIKDWRTQWNSPFPFYFVQIAPFTYGNGLSPALRDAQRKSLKTEKTGMAITMDIGSDTTIHPGNKQDVGERLARLALANDYGKNTVASGPLYKSHTIEGNKIIISFDHVADGLNLKDISGFEIAGSDNQFVDADVKIVGETLEVFAPSISEPKQVRYGWKDYTIGTLFNSESLPASSFLTR
tara:strand:+ start:71282 stop:73276 length:1995 start_codon:yes stop_codon:yes gene_type:complete